MTEQQKLELQAKIQRRIKTTYEWVTLYGRPYYTAVITEDGDRVITGTTPTTGKITFLDEYSLKDSVYIAGGKRIYDLRDEDDVLITETEEYAEVIAEQTGKLVLTFGWFHGFRESYTRILKQKTITLIATTSTDKESIQKAVAFIKKGEGRPKFLITTPEEIYDSINLDDAEDAGDKINYYDFLDYTPKGDIKDVNKNAIFEYMLKHHHFMIYKTILYYYKDGMYYPDSDGDREGIVTSSWARELVLPSLRDEKIGPAICSMIKGTSDLIKYEKDVNHYPDSYINFKNGYYDLKKKELHPHKPEDYADYAINQIPYEYHPDVKTEGPTIEKYLNDTFYRENAKELVLEYGGYCMTKDNHLQKIVILKGPGGSGKSLYIKLVAKMLGDYNVTTMDLKKVSISTWSGGNLFGKLANICGDIPTGALEDTAFVKQLSGGDTTSGEKKYKNEFNFEPYAKMLFSCNGMPKILNESSDGFYRRLVLVQVDKKPEKENTLYRDMLLKEMPHFIHLCVEAAERLFARENFDLIEYEDSEERVDRARYNNNSIIAFITDKIEKDPNGRIKKKELYDKYKIYCQKDERTPKGKQAFFQVIEDNKLIEERKIGGYDYYVGIMVKAIEDEAGSYKLSDSKDNVIPIEQHIDMAKDDMITAFKRLFRMDYGYNPSYEDILIELEKKDLKKAK